jgi:hypothetical protein
MSLTIFFVAGDVGGARALRPVIALAAARGINTHVLWHGHLASAPTIPGATLHQLDTGATPGSAAHDLLSCIRPDLLSFATSVHDNTSLIFARTAKKMGLPIGHLLDNWTSYRERLLLEGEAVVPDLYAVMDEVAKVGAMVDGIAAESIVITGTPALANLTTIARHSVPSRPLRLVFVSEPVGADQGTEPTASGFRGYTEDTVLSLVAATLADLGTPVRLDILAHPREDQGKLYRLWQSTRRGLAGGLVEDLNRQDVLSSCDGVVGMASILLYEMWLRGWPVASVQPALRIPQLRMLQSKPMLMFADNIETTPANLGKWVDEISTYAPPVEAASELARHHHAAEAFLHALGDLAGDRKPRITS